jgi:DNA-binding GntR family transcriptional regulator
MQDLVAEGIIYRVAGRGTYPVADNGRYLRHFGSVEDLMALSLDTVCQVIDPLRQRVDLEAAGRLQADSDSVVSLVVQRLYDAVPFSVTSISLPLSVGRLLDGVQAFAEAGARSRLTVIGCLEQRTPRLIANAEQSITAVSAPESAAAYLACAPGSAVLRVDRLYSDAAGTPVELAVSYFDPAYYTYRVRLRRT